MGEAGQFAVYQTEISLLPDRIVELIAQLHAALQELTDFEQTQINYHRNNGEFPKVVVMVPHIPLPGE